MSPIRELLDERTRGELDELVRRDREAFRWLMRVAARHGEAIGGEGPMDARQGTTARRLTSDLG